MAIFDEPLAQTAQPVICSDPIERSFLPSFPLFIYFSPFYPDRAFALAVFMLCFSGSLLSDIWGRPRRARNKHANSSDRRRMSMLTHSLAKFQPTTLGALPILSAPAYRDLPASRVCKPLPCSTASLSLCFARQPLSVHA